MSDGFLTGPADKTITSVGDENISGVAKYPLEVRLRSLYLGQTIGIVDAAENLCVAFEQFQGNPAAVTGGRQFRLAGQRVPYFFQLGFNLLTIRNYRADRAALGGSLDNRLQQFADSLPLAGRHRHDSCAEQKFKLLDVKLQPVAFGHIGHVETQYQRNPHLHQLGGQVEMAFGV
jgi:hypothetical protein